MEGDNKMPLYKMTTEDYGSDCIQAESFGDAEQIAIESILILKKELGIEKTVYCVIELMDTMDDLNNPLHESIFTEFFI
jgi:hypothetical protein